MRRDALLMDGGRRGTPGGRAFAVLVVIAASGCGSQTSRASRVTDSGAVLDGAAATDGASAADAGHADATSTDAQSHADTGGLDSGSADAPTTSPDGATPTDASVADSSSVPEGAAPDAGDCSSLSEDCSGTATCCAPYVCSGPTYDCVPDGGHCPWSGGFVCQTASQGSCAGAGSSCERASCCAPYVCNPNAGWTCTATGTCTTYGENCIGTACCDPFTCDPGTNACDFNYCAFSGSSCTYQTICCDGPCITSGGASFGVCR